MQGLQVGLGLDQLDADCPAFVQLVASALVAGLVLFLEQVHQIDLGHLQVDCGYSVGSFR